MENDVASAGMRYGMQWGLQLSLPPFRGPLRQRVGSILWHLCTDGPARLLPVLHLQDPKLQLPSARLFPSRLALSALNKATFPSASRNVTESCF